MVSRSLIVVLGNRPQFIKHAALHQAWMQRAHPDLRMIVVDTGQHYDYALAGVFLDELSIPAPDHELMVGSASHAEQLARMLVPLEELMIREKPASVVVYGDTNSTLGGMLAASKLNIPVAHIEAGLRSYDMTMPEEVNRVLVDHASSLLFAPTTTAVSNLAKEGIAGGQVRQVGDVMTDVAMAIAPAADRRWPVLQQKLSLPEQGTFAVATIHRAANTEPEALREIVSCLAAVGHPVLLPLHPRTQHALEHSGLHMDLADIERLHILPPLSYIDLAAAVRASALVVTDSGGLQKEAYLHGIPCITLRPATEWVETVEDGLNVLAGRDPLIVATAAAVAFDGSLARAIAERHDPYGDGTAAAQIVDVLIDHAETRLHLAL